MSAAREQLTSAYYASHVPKSQWHFDAMLQNFRNCATKDEFEAMRLVYILDMDYDRQDLLVAAGRVERERGWRG